MEIAYQRRLNKSYMMIEVEGQEETLDKNMLIQNSFGGLLPLELEIADGKERYWYDISGKQSLSDHLLRKGADRTLLCLLFSSLESLCDKLPGYLLEENSLILELEQIYMDFEGEKMFFTYLPGREAGTLEDRKRLLERLLQKLDHSDAKAVSLAYEMYQMALQGKFQFEQIMKTVWEDSEIVDSEESSFYMQPQNQEAESESMTLREEGRLFRNKQLKNKSNKEKFIKASLNLFSTAKEEFRGKNKYEPAIYPLAEEETIYFPTERLVEEPGKGEAKLLYQGGRGWEDFQLKEVPFLIGKKANEVNGCIPADTVSRIHAIIHKEGANYYIEDFNSTNGTYVNGERVEYRQQIGLKLRDRVSFGEEEYVFFP